MMSYPKHIEEAKAKLIRLVDCNGIHSACTQIDCYEDKPFGQLFLKPADKSVMDDWNIPDAWIGFSSKEIEAVVHFIQTDEDIKSRLHECDQEYLLDVFFYARAMLEAAELNGTTGAQILNLGHIISPAERLERLHAEPPVASAKALFPLPITKIPCIPFKYSL